MIKVHVVLNSFLLKLLDRRDLGIMILLTEFPDSIGMVAAGNTCVLRCEYFISICYAICVARI